MNITLYSPALVSSVGSLLGSDSIDLNTFKPPKDPYPTTIFFYNQTTHHFISSFSKYFNNTIIIKNINLKLGPFFVIAHDETNENNGVIADNIGGENVVD